jgi:hypothetical protein
MHLFRLAMLATALALALAGCAEAPTSRIATMRPDGVRSLLRDATYDGPLVVEVVNQPFAPEAAERTAETAARAVASGVSWRRIETTTRRQDHPGTPYVLRVILAAPEAGDLGVGSLCRTETPPAAVAEPFRIVLAVCAATDDTAMAEAAVRGHLPHRPTGADDPAFAALVQQMTRQMFSVVEDRERRSPIPWP